MVRYSFLGVIAILISTSTCAPSSYQYVRFIRDGRHKPPFLIEKRPNRSFHLTQNRYEGPQHELWQDDAYSEPVHNPPVPVEINRNHITPDFSDGLDYPDPYLLIGPAAKRAVAILYRKPLFFNEINHEKSLLMNQELRRRNGLAGHKIASTRRGFINHRY